MLRFLLCLLFTHMKLRNRLLALACLLVFIGFGFVYFHAWVEQKPFGIILFVSDSLSASTLTATRLYQGGASERLTLESFPKLGLLRNDSNDYAVPDAASAASALSTGFKGNNRAIAMSPAGKQLKSILALAKEAGRATGIITTGNLTDATPASFYAHATDQKDKFAIAEQFVNGDLVDITLAGGLEDFTPESKGGQRKDGRDLWLELRSKDHALVRNKAELENTPAFLTRPLTGIFANGNLPFSSQIESGSQQPSLSDMVRRAIQFLELHPKGYLLVVDAALISRAAEQNNGEGVVRVTADFDRAVAAALQYSGEKTLVICVGKQEIGGFNLNGYPLRGDHGVALLGTNAAGYPSITWSTGPNGPLHLSEKQPAPIPSGTSPLPATPTETAAPATPKEPAAFNAPQGIGTARDMLILGAGPGSEGVNGFMENTEVFKIIQKQL